jgi:hypothetical protein
MDAIGSVRHLRVSATSLETLGSIVKLIERSAYLESLSISFYLLNDLAGTLPQIATKSRLRKISVRFGKNEEEIKTFILSIAPSELHSLTLTGPRLDPQFLQTISERFRSLESLTLRISSHVCTSQLHRRVFPPALSGIFFSCPFLAARPLPKLAQDLEPVFSVPTLRSLSVRHLYATEFVPVLLHQKRQLDQHPFVAYFADKPVASRLHPLFVNWIMKDDSKVDFVSCCIEKNNLAAVESILPLHFDLNDSEFFLHWFMKILERGNMCVPWFEMFKSHGFDFGLCHWCSPAVSVVLRWQALLQKANVVQVERLVPEYALPTAEQPSVVVSLVELLNRMSTAHRQSIVRQYFHSLFLSKFLSPYESM